MVDSESQMPIVEYATPAPRPFPWRWIAYPALVVAVVVIMGVIIPSKHGGRGGESRAKCASNLHQIGLAILLYQQDYGGQYPDTLGRLTETEQIGSMAFVCPQSNDDWSTGPTTRAISDDVTAGPAGHHCSYIYLGAGLTDKTVTDATVVCYEPLTNHGGDGSNVLFGDGHVDWRTPSELTNLLRTFAPATATAR